ncbi:flagellin, partial [Actinoplanes sp. KI2]|nr:flagellin [Actinoplanes sp. KI2]
MTAVPTNAQSAWSFKLTEVGGVDISGSPITVNVAAVKSTDTPQDLAAAVNSALSSALKNAGYQGNEVTMTARVDSQNNASYQLSGAGNFSIDDTAKTVLTGAAGATGLGITGAGNKITGTGGTDTAATGGS